MNRFEMIATGGSDIEKTAFLPMLARAGSSILKPIAGAVGKIFSRGAAAPIAKTTAKEVGVVEKGVAAWKPEPKGPAPATPKEKIVAKPKRATKVEEQAMINRAGIKQKASRTETLGEGAAAPKVEEVAVGHKPTTSAGQAIDDVMETLGKHKEVLGPIFGGLFGGVASKMGGGGGLARAGAFFERNKVPIVAGSVALGGGLAAKGAFESSNRSQYDRQYA